MDATEPRFDLETFEKTIILMKKYGVHELRHNHFNIIMRYEPAEPQLVPTIHPDMTETSEVVGMQVSEQEAKQFMKKAQDIQEKFHASDEDILMNPYHGLDDLDYSEKRRKVNESNQCAHRVLP